MEFTHTSYSGIPENIVLNLAVWVVSNVGRNTYYIGVGVGWWCWFFSKNSVKYIFILTVNCKTLNKLYE